MVTGAQDEASQFVQLTWLFTTQPERLKVGRSVEMPLAISRRLERWIYDVTAEETLRFSFGPVATFHLKPRAAHASRTRQIASLRPLRKIRQTLARLLAPTHYLQKGQA